MNKLHSKVHKHLKLQQHKHTGKVLHHRHTSYRGLAVILVLAGVVMVGVTMMQRAAADSLFGVYATVQGPVPTTGAIINTPSSGDALTSSNTLVTGSCPIMSPQVTVALLVDNVLAGSAMCDSSNDFSMPLILNPGTHSIIAQTYTNTFGKGPDSQPVNITYPSAQPTAQTATPVITPTAPFTVLEADRTATWDGAFSGGTAPYRIIIDWGDGTTDSHTVDTDSQHFTHRYTTLQSYNARVAVRDATGASAQEQYAAVSYASLAADLASSTTPRAPIGPMVAGLYGLFLTVFSVTCIVWLEAKHAAAHQVPAT